MLAKVSQPSYDCINLIYEVCRGVCMRLMQSDLTVAVCNLHENTRLLSIIGILYVPVIADKATC